MYVFCIETVSKLPFADDGTESHTPQEETEENNFIEPQAPRNPQKPRPRAPQSRPSAPTQTPTEDMEKNEVVNTLQMCKLSFKCLFWIQFHLKMGCTGSGL